MLKLVGLSMDLKEEVGRVGRYIFHILKNIHRIKTLTHTLLGITHFVRLQLYGKLKFFTP